MVNNSTVSVLLPTDPSFTTPGDELEVVLTTLVAVVLLPVLAQEQFPFFSLSTGNGGYSLLSKLLLPGLLLEVLDSDEEVGVVPYEKAGFVQWPFAVGEVVPELPREGGKGKAPHRECGVVGSPHITMSTSLDTKSRPVKHEPYTFWGVTEEGSNQDISTGVDDHQYERILITEDNDLSSSFPNDMVYIFMKDSSEFTLQQFIP